MGISGKCDFQDQVEMFRSPEEILDKYQVYANEHELIPLKIKSKKDLVAYYPFLVAFMFSNKETGGHIHLSKRSYIDEEEDEWMKWKLDELKRYYRKCKRNKVEFDDKEAMKLISFYEPVEDYKLELLRRVKMFGNRATSEGVHDPMHDHMRKQWFDLMLENGWEKWTAYRWVYGWDRWLLLEEKNDSNN